MGKNMKKNTYMYESLYCTIEIKHNVVNEPYLNKKKKNFLKTIRGLGVTKLLCEMYKVKFI